VISGEYSSYSISQTASALSHLTSGGNATMWALKDITGSPIIQLWSSGSSNNSFLTVYPDKITIQPQGGALSIFSLPAAAVGDTTNYKPMVINSAGLVKKFPYWPGDGVRNRWWTWRKLVYR
jgi:hypothetical protein